MSERILLFSLSHSTRRTGVLNYWQTMYTLKVPKEQLSDLWRARQYLGRGPIAAQIKNAVNDYLKQVEKEIGAPIADIAEAIQQHEQESARE
ncbi:hypothetical protein KGQ34_03870 [Patescibacteria group bacterium]|nr:hypothetical protein [Patescibacteria group bacterium]